MEQPFHLERNLDNLLADMRVMKQLKNEVERKGKRKMESWLQKVNAVERELDEIQNQLGQLQAPGFHPNKYTIRLILNKKVIENIKALECLKSVENAEILGDSDHNEVETRIIELERGKKPQRYTYGELTNIISDVILGKGGFGCVYKGDIGKVEVAVKVLIEDADKVMEKQFMNEISPMFIASHKNLIRLHGYCFGPEKKALVYEYMVNRSLDRVLYNREANIQWDTLYQIAIGTAKALSNLHEDYSEPIIHYDIKAANVLLDGNYSPKVTDFGLCKIYAKDVSHVMQSSTGGTANYAAPEVRLGAKEITLKCDIYSFGLMLFEILRRKRVTKDFPPRVWERLIKGMLDKMILDCGVEEKDLEQARRLCIVGLWCTQFLPNNRPKMSDVVKVLEGVMPISCSPPNPDPYFIVSEASETPFQFMSSTKSDNYDERSSDGTDVEEDSWTEKKYASTSTLDIPVTPNTRELRGPRMPMYPPGGFGLGQQIFFAPQPGFGYQQQLVPGMKPAGAPTPMVQQDAQRQPQPGRSIRASQPKQNNQPMPIKEQMYRYPPGQGGKLSEVSTPGVGEGMLSVLYGMSGMPMQDTYIPQLIQIGTLATAFANATPEQIRTMTGDSLYHSMYQLQHENAAKVTAMLMDQSNISHSLMSPEASKAKLAKAMEALRNAAQQQQGS